MALMNAEMYDALIAAGAPDDKARAAATAMSEESLATKADVARLERDLTVIKWMIHLPKCFAETHLGSPFRTNCRLWARRLRHLRARRWKRRNITTTPCPGLAWLFRCCEKPPRTLSRCQDFRIPCE